MTDRDHAAGFTLLEMLVTLLIAGMALALTTQALGQYRRAHDSATASERATREHRLGMAWFRNSVRGLYPTAPGDTDDTRKTTQLGMGDQAPRFEGDADGFSGVTLMPVLAAQGVPVLQAWRIESTGGRPTLELQEAGETLALALPRAAAMHLHYMDPDGDLHDQWPPRLGLWQQLPAAVVLELVPEAGANDGILVAAAILGPRDPLRPIESAYEYDAP